MITVRTKQVFNRMPAIARQLSPEISDILRDTADDIAEDASRNAPGPAKNAIFVNQINQYAVELGFEGENAIIALAHEFGSATHAEDKSKSSTGGQPYEIRPVNAKVLHFFVNGEEVFAKRVMHPGIRPRPFLRPAIVRGKKRLERALRALFRRVK